MKNLNDINDYVSFSYVFNLKKSHLKMNHKCTKLRNIDSVGISGMIAYLIQRKWNLLILFHKNQIFFMEMKQGRIMYENKTLCFTLLKKICCVCAKQSISFSSSRIHVAFKKSSICCIYMINESKLNIS